MSDTIPYMTAELGVLQSQQIEHVLIIYPDRKVIQVERKDLAITLQTLEACKFTFRSILPMNDKEDMYLLISF